MLSERDIEQMKKPDLWKYHNEALRDCNYRLDGLMDCYREEQSYYYTPEQDRTEHIIAETEWTHKQYDRVKQLEARVLHYQKKVEELLKGRKPKTKYKTYEK